MVAALFRLGGWAVAKIFTDKILQWVAIKLVLTTLFIVILPIVLNNLMYDVMNMVMQIANTQTSGATFDGHMSFTGLGAYLITKFKIAECISVISGGLLMRLSMSMIPFIKL